MAGCRSPGCPLICCGPGSSSPTQAAAQGICGGGGGGTSGLLAARWAPGVPTRALTQAASLSFGPCPRPPGGIFSGPRVVSGGSSPSSRAVWG